MDYSIISSGDRERGGGGEGVLPHTSYRLSLDRRTQTNHRKAKKGHGWAKLERMKMDCIWVKTLACLFSNLRYVSSYMYQNVTYTAGKSFSVVMWP